MAPIPKREILNLKPNIKICGGCYGSGVVTFYLANQPDIIKQISPPNLLAAAEGRTERCIRCRGNGFTQKRPRMVMFLMKKPQ